MQIPDKAALFSEILVIRVLRPLGRFIASDWLRGGTEGLLGGDGRILFASRVLPTTPWPLCGQSADALRASGFADIILRDRHDWYRDLARQELAAMEGELMSVITARIGAERAKSVLPR